MRNLFKMKKLLYSLSILVCLLGGSVNAWADLDVNLNTSGTGTHYISATTADPAAGLVYMSRTNEVNVPDSKFKNYQPGGSLSGKDNTNCYISNGSNGCTPTNMFFWARPSRGYEFNGSWGTRGTDYAAKPSSKGIVLSQGKPTACDDTQSINEGPFDGTDIIQTTAGGQTDTHMRPKAGFKKIDPFWITYAIPAGGTYQVHYSYTKSYDTGEPEPGDITVWKFHEETEDYEISPSSEENQIVESYAADEITLTVPSTATNFIGWYEGETRLSTDKTYTNFKADHNATIRAEFKIAELGEPTGDLTPRVTSIPAAQTNYSITIPVTAVGDWAASDFTITFTEKTIPVQNNIVKGTATYSSNMLIIPFTYNPTEYTNTEVEVTVAPLYSESITFSILAEAEEEVDYEACIEEDGNRTYTGTLAAMMEQANSMSNAPTVKLMNPITITTPLSFTKSMTFDVNGKELTANSASAFSIDVADINVRIIDGSFRQVGKIYTSYSSTTPVSVVNFTQAAKLTMQGGTLSSANTGAGAAYGVDVQQGSVLYMTGGNITVTANSGNAQGVHVATASDYATLNGGYITVSAPTNAYGLWSAGQSNVENATLDVKTTSGTSGYGFYVNGGVTTLTEVTTSVSVKTAGAGGGFVKAGRLNVNGGSIAVTAENSDVYGVYIASGASAVLQQNAVITTQATGVSGTKVFGINNLGTVSLSNITVTATSPTTAATAVNSATSALTTTINGGTYRATAEGGTAYSLHHQYGSLNVDGGTFRAIGSGNNVYGACAVADATIANATITGETRGTGNTAYGFFGGVANKNITLTDCSITGQSNTSKAYAIYSRSNVTATGCTLNATTLGENYACGFYAENGTNNSVNTNATVSSYTTHAYGVYHAAGSMSVNGGTYNVEAKQTTASTAQNSELCGLYNAAAQTTNVNGASFIVTATNAAYSQNVYGAQINGALNTTDATYSAEAKLSVYGIWGNTASTLNLANNMISSTTTNGKNSYGVYAKKNFTINGDIINAVGTTTDVYAMFFDASTSIGDVLAGKFSAQTNVSNGYGALNAAGTVGKVRLKGGIYKTTINLPKYIHTGYQVFHLEETHSDYADGYRYVIATQNPSPYVCRIVGGAYYATLEEALQYTQDHSGTFTIVMTQNYTLPAGDYVLPANATLIVPRKFGQTTITDNGNPAVADKITTVGLNENFLCLTMASDAHLNVDGKIGVSGEMFCTESGGVSNQSPYGCIHMESGSHIQLNSGAYLYAWGMITGSGSITVKSNAEVREMFQIKNMPSASNLRYYIKQTNSSNTTRFMPFNQYSIQNIEVPTTYYYNSRLMADMRCYYAGAKAWYGDDNIKLVGTSGALFEVTSEDESSWVRKSYNTTTKQQVWEVNSSAQLGSLSITMKLPIVNQTITVNSADYILPITNTMKIHVLDGDFAITNDTELMPGSSVEINKTASLTVNAGKKLYVFDQHQWSSNTSYADAAINVHGNINVQGALYTTQSIEDGPTNANKTYGANIYSNNADAGTIFFANDAPSTTEIDLITGIENSAIKTKTVTMDPAQLKNGNGSYTATSGTDADHSFAYMDNTWTPTYSDECFEHIGDDAYAKPSDYVKLKKQRDAMGEYDDLYIKEDHTYESADGSRIFIHLPGTEGECQWWEVEATDNPTVFECKKEGYEGFYYYDEIWTLKTVTVTFYSKEEGEGDDILHTIVTDFNGRPDPSVIANNPSKTTTAEYTYQFYGWKSSESGTTYKWTDLLEVATADMNYRPVFTKTKRHYTVTFKDAKNGANVPVEVEYGASPEYAAVKASTAQYDYEFTGWKATDGTVYAPGESLPIVEGAGVSYTAQWSNIDRYYDITWKDGDRVIEVDEHQKYGTPTSYDDILPTRATDASNEYTFSGWLSSLDGNTYANGSTPSVGGETTYTAQFDATARYVVKFINYDGSELSSAPVTEGKKPVCAVVPRRDRDAVYYYVWTGWKSSAGTFYSKDTDLPAVTGKETYTAQFIAEDRMYTVTFTNIDNNGGTAEEVFGHSAVPTYNVSDREDDDYKYFFAGWKGEDETIYALGVALPEVTADATYTALFNQIAKRMEVNALNDMPDNTTYTVEEVHVHANGTLTIPESSSISATDLILDATVYKPGIDGAAEPASGEIIGAENLNISGNVYFDLTLNTEARIWHAFGVPFEVADLDAVKLIGDGREMSLGRDYEIIYYNGATRASQGAGSHCWEYLKHYDEPGQPVENLIPGKGYMIAFASHVGTVRFTKAAGAPIVYSASVRTNLYNSSIDGSNDWNAIATPALFHAALNAGVEYCQVHVPYEIGSDTYQSKPMAEVNFRTGMAVYVQAVANRAVVVTPFGSGATPAPRRNAASREFVPAKYEVTISTEGRTVPMDNLFIGTTEEKEDGYVTNSDLVKAGTTTKVAQMWVNRYGMKLCVNTMPMEEEAVAYPLTVYAPQTGEYIIAARARTDAGMALYLTKDGAAIWNLSESAYTLTLDKGTHAQYGVRLSAKAPQITTGIDEAVVDAQGETRKVLINDKVYIIRGEKVYSVDGQLVK